MFHSLSLFTIILITSFDEQIRQRNNFLINIFIKQRKSTRNQRLFDIPKLIPDHFGIRETERINNLLNCIIFNVPKAAFRLKLRFRLKSLGSSEFKASKRKKRRREE